MLGLHSGEFELGEAISVPLIEAAGGRFSHFDEVTINELPWGQLEIRFLDCRSAQATLTGIDGIQEMTLFQLAGVNNLDCY